MDSRKSNVAVQTQVGGIESRIKKRRLGLYAACAEFIGLGK
jgi:hypothetical protein